MSDGTTSDDAVSDRIQLALEISGLSQSELASRLDVGQSAVSQWIRGRRFPDREMLPRLATQLGVETSWLAYGVGQGPGPDPAARQRYRAELGWNFRPEPPDGSRDYGNANIFSFKPRAETLVREVVQNVLDARTAGRTSVTFTIRRLQGSELDGYLQACGWSTFESHLKASIDSGQQVGAALADGLASVDAGELLVLEIADYGTTGLLGPEVGEGNFAALCRNNLDSSKASAGAGGSYGLGKAVLWRMSSLSTVLFYSNLSEPAQVGGSTEGRFIGRSELVWHEVDGQAYAGPGWLGATADDRPDRAVSLWGNRALAHDLYITRTSQEPGTTILVLGYRDPSSEQDGSPASIAADLERAVAKHFWPALTEQTLEVRVQVAEGGVITRTATVDVDEHRPAAARMLTDYRRGSSVDKLLEPGDVVKASVPLSVPACRATDLTHDAFDHEAVVLVRRREADDESDMASFAQYFRGPGMIVFSRDLGRILVGAQPFDVAVLCGAAAGDTREHELAERFLRACEPPNHDAWELTEKVHREYRRGSGVALQRFEDSVRAAVRDILSPSVERPDDGPRDLAALFRLGPPTTPERAPRLVVDSAVPASDGAWTVEATVRVTSPGRVVVGRPAVVFLGETGSGARVKWAQLEATRNCTVDEDRIVVEAGKRTARFRGRTDPSSHPVPTADASVGIAFHAVREVD